MSTSLRPFFIEEYLRIFRSRTAILIWLLQLYALAMVPFITRKPPPELTLALEAWLGAGSSPAKLLLFAWIDTAMNKFAAIFGPVLAGGIIVDERTRGMLDLFASKPIEARAYYTIKLAAASAMLATFYLAGTVGALLTFPWRTIGFRAGDFLALSSVHFFAALFAVTFSGAMAVTFRSKLAGMLASILILGLLVGLAFLGFYYPAYRAASHLNPFFNGVALIGSIDHYGARRDIALPILLLILFNLAAVAIGRRRAAALLTGE